MRSLAIFLLLALSGFSAAQNPIRINAGHGRLSGFYRATRAGADQTDEAGSNEKGRYFYLAFFPDGRARRTRLTEGLANFDDAFWMNSDIRTGIPSFIRRWGTYRVSGEQGEIVFANREVWTFNLAKYPGEIECQGRAYQLLDPGQNLRLEGTYKSTKDKDSFITFAPGGKMTQQGIVSKCSGHFSSSMSANGIVGGSVSQGLCIPQPLPGAYHVGDYTLKLIFSNNSNTFPFWAEPGAGSANPTALYIDGVLYELVHASEPVAPPGAVPGAGSTTPQF